MANILLVDDEQDIIDLLKLYLLNSQHTVYESSNGKEAFKIFKSRQIDLVVADIMMPEMDGMELVEKIRSNSDVPILMLTAKDNVLDKIKSFGIGADDYLTKPFNALEAVARIQALLRRSCQSPSQRLKQPDEVLVFEDLRLRKGRLEIEKKGEKIELTPKEYKMLLCLMENSNHILTKKQLFEMVWEDQFFYSDENKLMVHISKLREKIEDDIKNPKYIKTVRGLGYVFEVKKQ